MGGLSVMSDCQVPEVLPSDNPVVCARSFETDLLERCVGDPDSFARDIWGKHIFRRHSRSGWDDVVSISDIDAILTSSHALRPASIRLIKDSLAIPITDYITTGTSRSVHAGVFDSGAVLELLTDGSVNADAVLRKLDCSASLVLQGAQRFHPPLADFCRQFELVLSHRCHVNLYITPPHTQAMCAHRDPHHLFVLQVHGTKEWVIGPTPFEQEAVGEQAERPVTIAPGDVLYLPTGTSHAVTSQTQWSVHIAVGVTAHTVRSLVQAEAARILAGGEPELDQSLPVGWLYRTPRSEVEEPAARARDLVARKIADLNPLSLVDGLAYAFFTQRRQLMSGSLEDRIDLPSLNGQTVLRRRPGSPLVLWPASSADKVKLLLGDRELVIDKSLSPAVRRIGGLSRFTPIELLSELGSEEDCVSLCSLLIREGAVTVVH